MVSATSAHQRVSVLDRLLYEASGAEGESVATETRAIVRDIENVLNTRCSFSLGLENWREVGASLLLYGLPDLTSFNTRNTEDIGRLRRLIATTIQQFEPRLSRVSVTLASAGDTHSDLRFRVTAFMRVDRKRSVPVAFDTVLEGGTNTVVVREAASGRD